jgi:hypothetical protein
MNNLPNIVSQDIQSEVPIIAMVGAVGFLLVASIIGKSLEYALGPFPSPPETPPYYNLEKYLRYTNI